MKEKIMNFLYYIFIVVIPTYGIFKFFEIDVNKYSNSFITLFFVLLVIVANKYKDVIKFKLWKIILSMIYSLMYVYGTIIDKNMFDQFFNIFKNNFSMNLLYLYTFGVIVFLIINIIENYMNKIKEDNIDKKIKFRYVIIIFLLILGSFIPYFIGFFPALCSPDSMVQIGQALNIYDLSNHHPIAHTMFIKLCFLIGSIFGGITAKVATYSIIQMIIMAMSFTYFIYFLTDNKCNKKLLYFIVFYFMMNPIFGFYSVTMWKDVLFGAFALVLMCQLYKLCFSENMTLVNKITTIVFVLLVALFRSNGTIVVLALSLFLLVYLKNKRKNVVILYLIPALVALVITGPVYKAFDITSGRTVESLGIPLRQISGVVAEGLPISKKDEKYLERLVGMDTIREQYNMASVDAIKFNPNFDNDYLEKDLGHFLKVWFNILKKYPVKYVDIYLKSTVGYWYVDAEGYTGHIWGIDSNEFNLKSSVNDLTSKLFIYHNRFFSFPIVEYFFKAATTFCVMLFSFAFSIVNKKFKYFVPILLPLLCWGTIMIASPVNYQARYVFALFTTLPFILFLTQKIFEKKDSE